MKKTRLFCFLLAALTMLASLALAEDEVYVEVPSFASYAGEYAVVDKDYGEDVVFYMHTDIADQLVDGYFTLLQEKYGFSGLQRGKYDGSSVIWLQKSGHRYTGRIGCPLDEGSAEGAVIILRSDYDDGTTSFIMKWGDHIGRINTSDRFQPQSDTMEVPSFASYAGEYATVSEDADDVFYTSSDLADQLIDGYFSLLQTKYGFSGIQHGMYKEYTVTWLLESGHSGTGIISCPLDQGTAEGAFILVRLDQGGYSGLLIAFGKHISMVDTGDRFQPQSKPIIGTSDQPTTGTSGQPTTGTSDQPATDTSGRKLLASPMTEETRKVTKDDNMFIQDIVPYCNGNLSYETISVSNDHNVRDVSGSATDLRIIDEYVELLLASNPYLTLVDEYKQSYSGGSTFFSYGINYTGSEYVGSKIEQTYTDNMCNIMIYGIIEYNRMECAIWTPRHMELLDLGKRYQTSDVDVSIGGQSALCGLYQTADGSYETSDGRLRTRLGEAMVLRDGVSYTTKATIDHATNRDLLWIRNFYRNETLHFSAPAHSLMQDDLLRLADVRVETSWIRDGRLKGEGEVTGLGWSNNFLAVNHGGEWMTVGNTEGCEYKDATIRVMYMDADVAVYYLYATFKTKPYELEALCAVPLRTVADPVADADYVTTPGSSIQIHYDGSEFLPTYELYNWEVLSGGSLVSLSNTKSETCTLTALNSGVVRLKITYTYGEEVPDALTGLTTSTRSHTKTREYVVLIR